VRELTYKLTDKGKRALKQLLFKVKCPTRMHLGKEIWSRSELKRWTGLDQATIVEIVASVENFNRPDSLNFPVEEETLLKIFQKLYQKLGCDKSAIDLASCELWEEYTEVRTNDLSIASRPEKLVKLLNTLDYVAQSGQFHTKISLDCTPLACFMPTPCLSTQKWAIHCLVRQIPNHNQAIRIPLIDVSQHPIRFGNIDLIRDEIAKKLKVHKRDVSQSLSQSPLNRPLIIALHNFGKDPDISPQNVIDEFWIPLLNEIPCRTPKSRIVLLMADVEQQFVDTSECQYTIKLPILNSITQLNVEDWLMSQDVGEWLVDEFGKTWRTGLDKKFPTWRWDNPSKILDRLCHAFDLENGAQSLHKKWEW
jgi:hypothetical protein